MVLVHGYGCNSGLWTEWLSKLQSQQVPCIAVDLEPVFASISAYGPLIEAAVTRMQQMTGLAPVVVGHSMGGLVVRAWWTQDREATRLHRLITLATPHQGTIAAQFGHGPAARQMQLRSQWLARLQLQETPAHAQRTLCFYSACDNIVIPGSSALLPGADNREVFGCAHVAMVDHEDCFAAALACVRESA
jgi:triacylglycerol esterase/lipase EstA (alpha/beta hydrolase family)